MEDDVVCQVHAGLEWLASALFSTAESSVAAVVHTVRRYRASKDYMT